MPSQNLVSGVLTDDNLNHTLATLKAVESSLGFLISLSPEQRKRSDMYVGALGAHGYLKVAGEGDGLAKAAAAI